MAGPNIRTRPTACDANARERAIREARTAAGNIAASLRGRPLSPFEFRAVGQLAAIGRRTDVARILGVNVSGFFAWWLWRTLYLGKLPRLEKKVWVEGFVQFEVMR